MPVLVLLPLVALAAGCATSSSGPAACGPSDVYAPGPVALGAVIDSAAFAGAVSGRWNPSWGLIVATLGPPAKGEPGTVTVVSRAGEPVDRWLADRIAAHRTSSPGPDQEVHVVVADAGGVAPRSVAALRTCPAELRDQNSFSLGLGQAISNPALGLPRGDTRMHTELDLGIDARGLVTEGRVKRPSGFPALDAELLRLAPSLRYRPATVEGVPVASRVVFPVLLRQRVERVVR